MRDSTGGPVVRDERVMQRMTLAQPDGSARPAESGGVPGVHGEDAKSRADGARPGRAAACAGSAAG